MLGVSMAVGAAALALVAAGCTSTQSPNAQASPRTAPTASHRISPSSVGDGSCQVTVTSSTATPPAELRYRPPPPVPYVDHWYGNDALWVMLPPDGKLPSQEQDGTLSTKFPWFRLWPGNVKVTAARLDGPSEKFSADVGTVAEYGDQGFTPSLLYWSAPGCWRITGQVGTNAPLTFVVQVQRPG